MKLRKERRRDLSKFVVNIGMRPVDYWALTRGERDAIAREHNRVTRAKSKKK